MLDSLKVRYSPTEPSHPDGQEILATLKAGKVLLVPENIRAGDYAFQSSHKQSIGFEYKNDSDLYASILSERIDTQLARLVLDYDVAVLVWAGSISCSVNGKVVVGKWKEHDFPYLAFIRKLIRFMWSSVSVVNIRTASEAGNVILGMVRSLENRPLEALKEKPTRVFANPIEYLDEQKAFLDMLPAIGPEKAEALLKKFGSVRKVLKMPKAAILRWQAIDGVGDGIVNTVDRFLNAKVRRK